MPSILCHGFNNPRGVRYVRNILYMIAQQFWWSRTPTLDSITLKSKKYFIKPTRLLLTPILHIKLYMESSLIFQSLMVLERDYREKKGGQLKQAL